MAVEQGDIYLPQSSEMTDAFNLMDARYFLLGDTLDAIKAHPIQRLQNPAGDYFSAAVAYLANRSADPLVEEVGTIAYNSIGSKQTEMILSHSTLGALLQLGLPEDFALRSLAAMPGEPIFLGYGEKSNSRGILFLEPNFIHKARTNPVEALATAVWICSQVRDLVNGRTQGGDRMVNQRASAIESQFLHGAFRQYSDLQVGPAYLKKMEEFPSGIESLNFDVYQAQLED